MPFFEFVTAPDVWPFSLSLLLFFLISGLEILMAVIGFGADFGLDVDLGVDVEVPEVSWIAKAFDWLGMGRVPYLVTLSGFLFLFGLLGLFVQNRFIEHGGGPLSWPWLALGCLAACIPAMRVVNHLIGRIWPKEIETSALSQDALIGQQAEITLGEISAQSAGQIKVRDPQGAMHYVLAVADDDSERFTTGDALLVIGRRGPHYTVRRHPFPARPGE